MMGIFCKALYLIGGPGVGKSTTLRWLLPDAEPEEPHRAEGTKLLWLTKIGNVTMLGKMREQFPGTDALSYAVLPEAVEWAGRATKPSLLIGEGQRLANVGFLSALSRNSDLTIVHLDAQDRALAERRAGRTQNDTWQRAATSRARNTAAACDAAGLRVYGIDTTHLVPPQVAQIIRNLTRW